MKLSRLLAFFNSGNIADSNTTNQTVFCFHLQITVISKESLGFHFLFTAKKNKFFFQKQFFLKVITLPSR